MSPALIPDRAAFREAVAQIAAKATEKLPECNGRVDSAVKLVLAGDVEVLDETRTRVYSASNGVSSYDIANGVCTCVDFPRAPHGFCKHRLAAAIYRRALALCPAEPETDQEPTSAPQPTVETSHTCDTPTALPEAPASVNCHITVAGRQVQLTLRDTDEGRLLARLEDVLQRFPVEQPASQPQGQGKDWCAIHGVPMRWNEGKDGRKGWYSHRTAQGQWCRGK